MALEAVVFVGASPSFLRGRHCRSSDRTWLSISACDTRPLQRQTRLDCPILSLRRNGSVVIRLTQCLLTSRQSQYPAALAKHSPSFVTKYALHIRPSWPVLVYKLEHRALRLLQQSTPAHQSASTGPRRHASFFAALLYRGACCCIPCVGRSCTPAPLAHTQAKLGDRVTPGDPNRRVQTVHPIRKCGVLPTRCDESVELRAQLRRERSVQARRLGRRRRPHPVLCVLLLLWDLLRALIRRRRAMCRVRRLRPRPG